MLPAQICRLKLRISVNLCENFGDAFLDTTAFPDTTGRGGTWDLNVLGNGHGATTNDVFAKAMVVGAPCLRCVPDAGSRGRTTPAIALCHRTFDRWVFLLAPRYI
jgi:hypothetical protein